MPQMTTGQARVIDPILSAVARGYRSPKAAAANALFPIVQVPQRAGRIISFGPDDFKLVSTQRAPGANTQRVQFGYGSEPYSLVDHRLEGGVPGELHEEAAAVPGIDLSSLAVRRVQNTMALEREKKAADLARNAGLYDGSHKKTLSGTSQWSDVGSSSTSTPIADVMTAKEAVRASIGERPNTMVISPKALTALRSHPHIIERLNIASDRSPATLAQLSALLEIDNIVEGAAVYHDGTAFADVWGTDVIIAYTTPASLQEMGSPSYGYTYQLEGRPMVEEGYYEPNSNSWYYPVSDAYQPVLAGVTAGYLIQSAAA